MSVTRRLISGSAASWLNIGITVLSQVVLVPIYLSFWKMETYGVWLAVQALSGILSMLDLGHHTFLGYEFLRLKQEKREEISLYLWSGVLIGFFVGLAQIVLILILLGTGIFGTLLSDITSLDSSIVKAAGIVLLLQGAAWVITTSIGGIFVRVLTAFDYYPRLAWWGVFATITTSAGPAIAVALGANLITTGIVLASITVVYNIFLFLDMFRLLRKEKINYQQASFRLGYQNFLKSLALSGRNLLENARIAGVRIILIPVSGAQGLVTFSTIRTGANFAMQGLHTITNPLMPELMKFLHQRDQDRSETAFGTIWIIIVAVMAPGVVILQTIIAPLFTIWTRHKVPFDPVLFAILSLSVLVYAIAQPAIAIVMGNNLLKAQLILSGLAAIIVVAGIFILVPKTGILGAGIALLTAEIIAAIGYKIFAKRWLKDHGLLWPAQSSIIAARSIWISAVSMGAILIFPAGKWIILICSLVLMFLNLSKYWHTLPAFARNRSREMMCKLPLIKKIITI